jgi:integrase
LASEIDRIEKGGRPCCIPWAPHDEEPSQDYDYDPEAVVWASDDDDYKLSDEFLDQQILNDQISEALNPLSVIWEDRLARERRSNVPPDRTIGTLVNRYLEHERSRLDADQISMSEYGLVHLCLDAFREWIGPESAIEVIDAERWENYYLHLMRWDKSVEYKKKRFRHARNFIDWAVSLGLIPTPPNLHRKQHRFGGTAKIAPIMTIDEVKRLIKESPGQLKLHLLLMANCGMTQIDISDLRQEDVDWRDGRIIRKRSKTAHEKNVPTVNYKLWPITWELLQHYRQPEGERVLLTESGKPWVRDWIGDDGKRKKTDSIKSNYVHVQRRLRFTKSMKLIRKTSATLIDRHETYGRLNDFFLGHAPRSVSEQNYNNREGPFELFDQAIAWLGQQYGYLGMP